MTEDDKALHEEYHPDYSDAIPDWLTITDKKIHSLPINAWKEPFAQASNKESKKYKPRNVRILNILRSQYRSIKQCVQKYHMSDLFLDRLLTCSDDETLVVHNLLSLIKAHLIFGDEIKMILYISEDTHKNRMDLYKEFIRLRLEIGTKKAAEIMLKKVDKKYE